MGLVVVAVADAVAVVGEVGSRGIEGRKTRIVGWGGTRFGVGRIVVLGAGRRVGLFGWLVGGRMRACIVLVMGRCWSVGAVAVGESRRERVGCHLVACRREVLGDWRMRAVFVERQVVLGSTPAVVYSADSVDIPVGQKHTA